MPRFQALLCALLLAGGAPDTSPRSGSEDLFPLREGMTWVYARGASDVTVKVTGRERIAGRTCWIMETTLNNGAVQGRKWVFRDARGVWVIRYEYSGSILDYEKPVPYFRLPAGKTHSWKWEGSIAGNPWKYEGKQVGVEDVKHGDRAYRCIRTHVDYEYAGSAYAKDYWFAPGVGLLKTRNSGPGAVDTTEVLKEFRPGPPR